MLPRFNLTFINHKNLCDAVAKLSVIIKQQFPVIYNFLSIFLPASQALQMNIFLSIIMVLRLFKAITELQIQIIPLV